MPEITIPAAPVAIVTAASKGIGAACARLLAQRGFHLALFARGSELSNLATELDALAVTGDLADSAAIEQLVHQTQQRYGRVDAVVNNTGHAAKGDLLTLTDEDWHHGLDLLLLNVIRLARLVTPIMLAQERPGAFVNISSFVALEPGLSFPVSATIRAGLSAFTKLYVQQYGSRGLRMNNVLPGRIDTYPVSMEAVRQIPLARPGTADDVARVVAFLLSEDAAYIAGQDLLVDGGLVRAM
jgi:NAD(P)-dependent dehydrogenase (short-subunit alcohol dehydrogenase family)